MTEPEPHQAGIDSLLRRSMAAPVPSLSPDFDQRLIRELHRSSPVPHLLTSYGLISVVTSTVVMRSQGLQWAGIAAMILGPLALVAAVSWARRSTEP